jgi:hypothetical protein
MFIGCDLLSISVVDPHWFQCGSGSVPVSSFLGQCGFGSGSRDLIIENLKNLLDEQKKSIFFVQKLRNIFH